jgi:YlmC/YmxH family sporulation protein
MPPLLENFCMQYFRSGFFLYWELLSLCGHRTFPGAHSLFGEVNAMQCRIQDMRCKEVINICDGCRLGYVADVDIRVPEGQVAAIVVYGPCRFFGLFGRGEEFYIPWDCIQRIGDDIILIDKPFQRREPGQERKRRRKF